MRFDDLLLTVGEFGPAQKRLYLLLLLPTCFSGVAIMGIVIFLFAVPHHRCAILGMDNDTYEVQNEAHHLLINLSIPLSINNHGNLTYSPCELYVSVDENNTSPRKDGNITRQCNRWVYDKTVYTSTISQALNFVCSRKSYSTHVKSVSMAGQFLAGLVSGPLSDRFGRRKVILISMAFGVIFSFCLTWVTNIYMLLPLVLLIQSCMLTLYVTCFVFCMEIIGPSIRMLTGVASFLFWTAGNIILAFVSYLVRNWKTRQLVLTVPCIIFVYLYFLPDSPGWLLRRGKRKEAEEEMVKIAKQNNVRLTTDSLNDVVAHEKEEFWSLFKSPVMVKKLLMLCCIWFAIGMGYYGLSMNITNLSGNVYLNVFLFAIIEAFAFIVCLYIIKRIQRRWLVCGSMVLAGISCFLTFIPFLATTEPNKWIVNTLACLGNTCVSVAFVVVYVFTAELMPTPCRNVGLGLASSSARVGSMISPYISDLTMHITGRYSQILPMLTFGGIITVCGLLTLLLPETNHMELPDTIEDAENLGTSRDSLDAVEDSVNDTRL